MFHGCNAAAADFVDLILRHFQVTYLSALKSKADPKFSQIWIGDAV